MRTAAFAAMLAVLAGACRASPPAGAMEERGGCPFNYAPVCGSDGETHANACIASSHDAGVAYTGECRPGIRIVCRPGSRPACGADGRSYPNRCAALTAGVEVLHNGVCTAGELRGSSAACGGRNGVRCPTGQRYDVNGGPPGRLDAMGVDRWQ